MLRVIRYLIGLALVAITAAVLVSAYRIHQDNRRFGADAPRAQATIVVADVQGSGTKRLRHYEVAYLADGRPVQSDITQHLFAAEPRLGDTFEVVYLGDDPTQVRDARAVTELVWPYLLSGLGLALLAGMAFAGWPDRGPRPPRGQDELPPLDVAAGSPLDPWPAHAERPYEL